MVHEGVRGHSSADNVDRRAPANDGRVRRLLGASLLSAVVLMSCGSDGGSDTTAEQPETEAEFEAAFDCDELADRWGRLQQEFLDRLGDADAVELDDGSVRLTAAQRWMGNAMIEQARDTGAAGCDDRLTAGSPALCDRLDGLKVSGEAAGVVLGSLREDC